MRWTLIFSLALFANPAVADNHGCSEQFIRTIEFQLPRSLERELDIRQLSCTGIKNVYLIIASGASDRALNSSFVQAQRIRTIFRREGLIP